MARQARQPVLEADRQSAWTRCRAGRSTLALDEEIPPSSRSWRRRTSSTCGSRSERLSKFWGRDVYLAAFVTLPWGFDTHPEARYPLVINHGHFPAGPGAWRETPPDPDLEPDYSKRFRLAGYNRIQQQLGWELFQAWTGPGFPRVLMIEIQHPTPFYDDSYAVNSANNGPYGDAIQYELIPEIEQRFRGLGQGWARFVFGGSTGGWEAMAVQMFYPDDYNGAWMACPDPIDFHHYMTVDLYNDKNAYFMRQPRSSARRARRTATGSGTSTPRCRRTTSGSWRWARTAARATSSTSGSRCYSPVGDDGYPRRIWDRLTGEIDPVTVAYWKDHYDLAHILQRDWPTLGPKLRGKLRIYVGDMDNYYLNNAVYGVEKFLRSRRARLPTRWWTTATATSTAGTATTPGPTPIRACATRRWCCPGRWNAC